MSPRITKWPAFAVALALLAPVGSALAAPGLKGEYFDVRPLVFNQPPRAELFQCKSPVFTRIDPNVDYHWGEGTPVPNSGQADQTAPPGGFDANGFAVRWTGTLSVDAVHAGKKQIVGFSDDGMRIWIKDVTAGPIQLQDNPVFDLWVDQGPGNRVGEVVDFVAGHQYAFLVEMYENGGGADASVRWVDENADPFSATDEDVIPAELFTTDFDASGLGGAAGDTPGAPGALTPSDVTDTSVKLTFTAPGGNGSTGTAGCYEVRYSTSPITAADFDKAQIALVNDLPPPAPAGTTQTFVVGGLEPLEAYYIGVRAKNLNGNAGPPSNIVQVNTHSSGQSLPTGQDGRPGAVVYLYSPTPQTNGDRLTQMFLPSLFAKANVETSVNQFDDYAFQNGVNDEAWAMRYTFTLTFPQAGTWYLDNNTDDGGRIWFRDAPIDITDPGEPDADDWAPHGPRETFTGPLTVEANKKYYVLFEWYESGGGAQAQIMIGKDTEGHSDKEVLSTTPNSLNYKMETYYIKPGDLVQQGRLKGGVTLPDGSPSVGAVVTATAADGTTKTTRTDRLGGYSMIIKAGTYTLTAAGPTSNAVRGEGAAPAPATVNIDQVLPDQNIALKPIKMLARFPEPVERVVYRDSGQATNWILPGLADHIRDVFVGQGFTAVNADGLRAFMLKHVADQAPSVVVMANDAAPVQVVTLSGDNTIVPNSLVRQYLDAGGRMVYMGDVPFNNISKNGANIEFGDAGAPAVLGFPAASEDRDAGTVPEPTAAATALGLTRTWSRGLRPAALGSVDVYLYQNPMGNADGWIKFFPKPGGAGMFIYLVDDVPDDLDDPDQILSDEMLGDVLKLANLGGINPLAGPAIGCKGDADGNGEVNVNDAVAQLRHITGIQPITDLILLENANVTEGDVDVDVTDVVRVLRAIVGAPDDGGIRLTCDG